MSGKHFFIVGIGGATNSGKSSISSMLCRVLPHCEWICQDDYFLAPDDPNVEIQDGYRNWDTLSALDMKRMVRDVEHWISRQQSNTELSVLIVEGFLIFDHSELATLLDKKYFITVTKETCEKRRKLRVYNPPDTPGYFDIIVWPSYVKHLESLKRQNDIEYVDGQADLETLGQTVLSKIEAALQKERVNGIVD